jgi:hypothetical protein
MTQWNQLADEQTIERTKQALEANGITVTVVPDGVAAKVKVLEMIPAGAEVMNMISMTLETIGLNKEILESGNFKPVRAELNNEATPAKRKREIGAAPDWAIGSVHAVSEEGVVFIASNSGSQLPAYAYGAGHVIWVVSTKKIVKDRTEALQRIYEHVLPQESERAKKAYGVAGSNVSKLLMIAKENQPNRIDLIFVKESLGF